MAAVFTNLTRFLSPANNGRPGRLADEGLLAAAPHEVQRLAPRIEGRGLAAQELLPLPRKGVAAAGSWAKPRSSTSAPWKCTVNLSWRRDAYRSDRVR